MNATYCTTCGELTDVCSRVQCGHHVPPNPLGIDKEEAERRLWKMQAQHMMDRVKRESEIEMAPVRIATALERIASALENLREKGKA